MKFSAVKYKARFTDAKPVSDWLACFHLYRIDPRDAEAIKKAPKFIRQNLPVVANTLKKELAQLNITLSFSIIKNTTIDDFRYNMYLNIAENVCVSLFLSYMSL